MQTFTLKVKCVYVQNVQCRIIRVLDIISKLLEKLDWMHGIIMHIDWIKHFGIRVCFVKALLPATPLVPCDRLSGRARRLTRGCERQRSGHWRWWRPAWRTAAWCKPQTQWRGKTTPVGKERETEWTYERNCKGGRQEDRKHRYKFWSWNTGHLKTTVC